MEDSIDLGEPVGRVKVITSHRIERIGLLLQGRIEEAEALPADPPMTLVERCQLCGASVPVTASHDDCDDQGQYDEIESRLS